MSNTNEEDFYDRIGEPVPLNRVNKASVVLKSMMPNESNLFYITFIRKCVNSIERNQVHNIIGNHCIDEDMARLDLTGRYRMLAELLTD